VNTDLEKARYNISYVRRFYEKANAVFADSRSGGEKLNRLFPKQKNVFVFPNMMDEASILERAKEYKPEYIQNSGCRLLTVGRLCEAKALHLAISAAAILKQRKLDFVWYILGDGSLRKALEEQISELNLQNNVILLGKRNNPYPWFAECDIYIQTSVYEGSCMTINEAMLFGKPVVTTNFSAAYEKIRHLKNGLICEMTAEDIAEKTAMLLTDNTLYCSCSKELLMHPLSFDDHMDQLEKILNA
jgi:glycosyltransferase involved in cell wall biosynthesis